MPRVSARAGASPACEERGAVQYNTKPAPTIYGRPHLGNEVQKKEQGPVAHARQTRSEPTIETHLVGFPADLLLDLLPLYSEGRIGEHVVEVLPRKTVVLEHVPDDDVPDIRNVDELVR